MIVIRVMMHPQGDESRAYELATAVIINKDSEGDTPGTATLGNYCAGFYHGKGPVIPSKARTGFVKCFPRKRLNVWHLIERALRDAGYS